MKIFYIPHTCLQKRGLQSIDILIIRPELKKGLNLFKIYQYVYIICKTVKLISVHFTENKLQFESIKEKDCFMI